MKYRAIYKGGEVVAKFENDRLVWAAPEYLQEPATATHIVMPDIQPYRSQIDGSMIGSRSTHRAHLRQHGCLEIGNETKYLKPAPLTPPPGLKQKLIEVANAKLR